MKKRKENYFVKTTGALLLGITVMSVGAPRALAEEIPDYIPINAEIETASETRARVNYSLPGIPSRYLSSYKKKSITLNGNTVSGGAPIINGITYVSVKGLSEAVGAKAVYSSSSKTMTVSARGLYMTLTHGGYVVYANDRPLFSFSPIILMTNGELYAPLSALEKAFGIKRTSESDGKVTLGGYLTPLTHASKYYRDDEVLWLSKIISAESSGESLIGQIAVGDVIMNRVKSQAFPNTIWSVIFDKKYGVQFSPTSDGRIYETPTYTATLAAKICLEGISLSDNAMYFLNPRTAQSNWIVRNREYVYTIGNHDFYK